MTSSSQRAIQEFTSEHLSNSVTDNAAASRVNEMQKQKKYKWQDTNLALFGSDLEKKIKAAAADGEDQWKEVGKEPELRVWRIEAFKVVPWPRKKYGTFHTGDSYVLLRTFKPNPKSDKLSFDIHFWIGNESTADEYGTAAYKTVELDHKLGDLAVQHREVQEHESKGFLELFERVTYLDGGVDSGFNHVEPEKYVPRLLQFKGASKGAVVLKEVRRRRDTLNSGDVFVLDGGLKIWQWNGKEANVHEKRRASVFVQALDSDRSGKPEVIVLEEGSDEEASEFWELIPGERRILGLKVGTVSVQSAEDGGDDDKVKAFPKTLFKLSDASGSLRFKRVGRGSPSKHSGNLSRKLLNTADVFVLDTGFVVFVWVGKGASSAERAGAMRSAHDYLEEHKDRPDNMPISRVTEGHEPAIFTEHFYTPKKGEGRRCTVQ